MNVFFEFMGMMFISLIIIFGIASILGLQSFSEKCRLNGGAPMSTQYGDKCVYNYKLN